MAVRELRDVTNQGSYKVQAWIENKYKPLIIRGRELHTQISKSSFGEKRRAGACNIDLWLDSSLYPIDPCSGKRPKLESPSALLEFIGEGENGFLGYVKRLESMSGGTSSLVNEKEIEIALLRGRIDDLIRASGQEMMKFESELSKLQNELRSLQRDYESRCSSHESEISMRRELESRISNSQEIHDQSVTEIRTTHKLQLDKSNAGLKRVKRKVDRLVRTPFGIRSQIRKRRDLYTLAPKGGHAKATRRLARLVVAAETTRNIQAGNAEVGSHQRLCGSKSVQKQSGKVFGSILSQTEIDSMLQLPHLSHTGIRMTNHYLQQVGNSVGRHEILQTCDESGITQKGYKEIYKKIKGGVQTAGKGLRLGCLPNPHQVELLRKELNGKLEDLVGQPKFLNNTYEVSGSSKKSKTKEKMLKLDNNNNIFLDVEAVQRTMIHLYKITEAELMGVPLLFVLKMDEAEIVHTQKMERISITLMNRALNPGIRKNSEAYISVQSEREIWPIGCFRVPKENHEVLQWVFQQTSIPSLIEAQNLGQALEVAGVGSFQVQWHLSADMKTIKSLYGLQAGANAKHCCIYCMQSKTKTIIASEAQAVAAAKQRSPTWEGGLFSSSIPSKPISVAESVNRWKPIFSIPLEQVHICTLHALNRICEKMLHLHFQYVWTIRDKQVQQLAIHDIESILSATGMHGGFVKIFKDPDLSGKTNNVPNKPSLSGANTTKLFKKSSLPSSSDRVWRDIILAERNAASDGSSRRDRMACWSALEQLLPYFCGLSLTPEQCSEFQKLADAFGKLFIKVHGEHHVTHYLHVFIKHGPWFVTQYGSLSVWSCQGMEFSHHAAKAAYHRHTQHGGANSKISPLLQTYEHWFRIIQHRLRNNDMQSIQVNNENEQADEIIQKRREASINSSSADHSAEWRSNCERVGSRWVPKVLNGEASNTNDATLHC